MDFKKLHPAAGEHNPQLTSRPSPSSPKMPTYTEFATANAALEIAALGWPDSAYFQPSGIDHPPATTIVSESVETVTSITSDSRSFISTTSLTTKTLDAPVTRPNGGGIETNSQLTSPAAIATESSFLSGSQAYPLNSVPFGLESSTLVTQTSTFDPLLLTSSLQIPTSNLQSPSAINQSDTASTMTPTTQGQISLQSGNSSCTNETECVPKHTSENKYKGVIAGSVFGVVGVGVLGFAAAVCYRRKIRSKKRKTTKSKNSRFSEGNSERRLSQQSTRVAFPNSFPDARRDPQATTSRSQNAGDSTLGEPGPAFARGEMQKIFPEIPIPVRDRYTIDSIPRSLSIGSDPFITPFDTKTSIDRTSNQQNEYRPNEYPNQSQIGLALSRYSTAATMPSPSRGCSNSNPHASQSTDVTNEHSVSTTSSVSVTTANNYNDEFDPDQDKVFVERARTAQLTSTRRHSLTPRVVNIVATGIRRGSDGHSNEVERLQTVGGEVSVGVLEKNFAPTQRRARSASPAKTTDVYDGSPAKLHNHFGISTWRTEVGRTGSSSRQACSSNNSNNAIGVHNAEHDNDESNKHPPTSYRQFKLEKRPSEGKKDLEEAKSGASKLVQLANDVLDVTGGREG